MSMDKNSLRRRMLGCFLGKAAGGTLGQPYEGYEGPLGLTFYDPVPEDMIPNDDLDLQLVFQPPFGGDLSEVQFFKCCQCGRSLLLKTDCLLR